MRNASLTRLLAVAITLAPLAAGAQSAGSSISYSFADLAYVTTDVDGVSKDLDGWLLRGSFEPVENLFVYGRYADQSVSFAGGDVDTQTWALGVGYAFPLADRVDLYGKAGYINADGSAGPIDLNDDGYEIGAGLRARPLDPLELEGSVTYQDLSDAGDDTVLGIGARWYIADQFAMGLEGEFSDDADTYGIGFRWAFGNR
jgi:opacity protein-like surface antigen